MKEEHMSVYVIASRAPNAGMLASGDLAGLGNYPFLTLTIQHETHNIYVGPKNRFPEGISNSG
jgi:hypothetical protein